VRKRPEFLEIQATGRRVTTPGFFLILRAASGGAHTRIGVTASRKVGCAAVRNRAKRLVREAFRATRDLWGPGLDLVVVVRSVPSDLTLDAVVRQWRASSSSIRRRAQEAHSDRARRESDLAQRA
jgi:ribonuclease P protein component